MLTLGQIKYAIDHNTGQLDGSVIADRLEVRGKTLADVKILGNGNQLKLLYRSNANTEEQVVIERGNKGFYNIQHDVAVGGQPVAQVKARCTDLRQVQYEKRTAQSNKVFRNAENPDGTPKMAQYGAMLNSKGEETGGSPELVIECLSAMKSYARNKDKGVLRENREKRNRENEKARGYQGERREAIKILKTAVTGARAVAGLDAYTGGVVISVSSVCEYTYNGLIEAARKVKAVKATEEVLRSSGIVGNQEAFKSGVDAVKVATKAANSVRDIFNKKTVEEGANTTPAKMKNLIAAWDKEAVKAGYGPYDNTEGIVDYFSNLSKNLLDYYQSKGTLSENVDSVISSILDEVSEFDGMPAEKQLKSKKVYNYGASLLKSLKSGVKYSSAGRSGNEGSKR